MLLFHSCCCAFKCILAFACSKDWCVLVNADVTAYSFFGDGSFTSSLSKRSSKSFQQMNSEFHLKILEKNYFCLVCMNAGVLIICWVTKSMINMFQWFQYKCFLTVCWPYYHGVSEISLAMYEKISKSILKSLKIGV